MILTWLAFALASAIIVIAGVKLTSLADALAERTGIQRGFIGVLLLGLVTSLPEVITSLSAVLLFNATPMAAGNLLGSCTFNLLIIVVLDSLFRLDNADRTSMSAGILSIGMVLIVLVGYLVPADMPSFYLDPFSFLVLLGYIVSLYVIWRQDVPAAVSETREPGSPQPGGSLLSLAARISLFALVLVATSVWMSDICDRIAAQTGLGGTFVGAFFMAASTSLPELTVSIAALRMGQMSLSLGNIYGSNIFNIGILSLVDLAEGKGSLFARIEDNHAFLSLLTLLMSVLLLYGFRPSAPTCRFRVRPVSLVAGLIYIAGTLILFYNASAR